MPPSAFVPSASLIITKAPVTETHRPKLPRPARRRPRPPPLATAQPPEDASQTPLFRPGEQVNGYRIGRPLGRGATSITFEATSPSQRHPLALKALPLSGLASWKVLDLFEREARTLRALSHPSIPAYVDFFQVDRAGDAVFVLVQRKASGTSLQHLLDDGHRFTTQQIEHVFTNLLDVLCYLASLNPPVLHRDIKPSNVLLDLKTNAVALVDFGAVDTGFPGSTVVGTFGYMPPEQFSGAGDVRSDLYAVAATILYMLTGRPPASLPQKRLRLDLEDAIPARERLKLGNVYTVMARLLEPAPEDRFDTPSEALAALTATTATEPADVFGLGSSRALSAEQAFSLAQALNSMTPAQPGALRMLTGWAKGRRRKPAGSRIVLERDARSRLLRISIPARGISGDAITRGAFAVAWTGFTAFWTVGVLTGGAPLIVSLFSLPFWAAGVQMGRGLANEVAGVSSIVLSFGGGEKEVFYFGLSHKGPFGAEVVEGDSRDVDRAVLEGAVYAGGQYSTELVICEGTRKHGFGGSLTAPEQEWLRDEINDFLGCQSRW